MLPRHDQRSQAMACNDNGPSPAFRWNLIQSNLNIARVAAAISGSIVLHYVADGVLIMTRPMPLVSKLVGDGAGFPRRAIG
jgi:hypothetical protein